MQYALQPGQFDHPDNDMFTRIRIRDWILQLVLELYFDHDELHLGGGHPCV